jgi:hypothetical protein
MFLDFRDAALVLGDEWELPTQKSEEPKFFWRQKE